ncbi:MAG: RNA polymerase sigma-70 factor [Carboxylicivirga sp.]|nr:RNA polymerase sigma-70 factor [Carboxylicivirga sp.]
MRNNKQNIELLKLLKKGDMAAFDAVYNRYCQKMHNFVLSFLKVEADAEEVVQEVFIKIWEAREKVDVYASFESFLFTITYNSTMSLLRQRLTEKKSKEYLKNIQQIDLAASVIDEMQYVELKNKVEVLLNNLTPRQKEIYLLSREDGLTHREIAIKLDISENTVKNHLVTTLKYLKNKMDKGLIISALFCHLFFL